LIGGTCSQPERDTTARTSSGAPQRGQADAPAELGWRQNRHRNSAAVIGPTYSE
jgi:hypothetical protein